MTPGYGQNEADDDGNTALQWVASYCLINSQAALLVNGARAHARNKRRTDTDRGPVPRDIAARAEASFLSIARRWKISSSVTIVF